MDFENFILQPFHEIMNPIVPLTQLKTKNIISSKSKNNKKSFQLIEFTMEQNDIKIIEESRKQKSIKFDFRVIIRICQNIILNDNFPLYLELNVNDKEIDLPKYLPYDGFRREGRRYARPIDITEAIMEKSSPINNCVIHWMPSDDDDDFNFAIYLVRMRSCNELISALMDNRVNSMVNFMNLLSNEVNRSGLITSLICPVSMLRIKTPIRGDNCTHLQCFDCAIYLALNLNKPTWKCPICGQSATFSHLLVDDLIFNIIKDERSLEMEDVAFNELGQWQSEENLFNGYSYYDIPEDCKVSRKSCKDLTTLMKFEDFTNNNTNDILQSSDWKSFLTEFQQSINTENFLSLFKCYLSNIASSISKSPKIYNISPATIMSDLVTDSTQSSSNLNQTSPSANNCHNSNFKIPISPDLLVSLISPLGDSNRSDTCNIKFGQHMSADKSDQWLSPEKRAEPILVDKISHPIHNYNILPSNTDIAPKIKISNINLSRSTNNVARFSSNNRFKLLAPNNNHKKSASTIEPSKNTIQSGIDNHSTQSKSSTNYKPITPSINHNLQISTSVSIQNTKISDNIQSESVNILTKSMTSNNNYKPLAPNVNHTLQTFNPMWTKSSPKNITTKPNLPNNFTKQFSSNLYKSIAPNVNHKVQTSSTIFVKPTVDGANSPEVSKCSIQSLSVDHGKPKINYNLQTTTPFTSINDLIQSDQANNSTQFKSNHYKPIAPNPKHKQQLSTTNSTKSNINSTIIVPDLTDNLIQSMLNDQFKHIVSSIKYNLGTSTTNAMEAPITTQHDITSSPSIYHEPQGHFLNSNQSTPNEIVTQPEISNNNKQSTLNKKYKLLAPIINNKVSESIINRNISTKNSVTRPNNHSTKLKSKDYFKPILCRSNRKLRASAINSKKSPIINKIIQSDLINNLKSRYKPIAPSISHKLRIPTKYLSNQNSISSGQTKHLMKSTSIVRRNNLKLRSPTINNNKSSAVNNIIQSDLTQLISSKNHYKPIAPNINHKLRASNKYGPNQNIKAPGLVNTVTKLTSNDYYKPNVRRSNLVKLRASTINSKKSPIINNIIQSDSINNLSQIIPKSHYKPIAPNINNKLRVSTKCISNQNDTRPVTSNNSIKSLPKDYCKPIIRRSNLKSRTTTINSNKSTIINHNIQSDLSQVTSSKILYKPIAPSINRKLRSSINSIPNKNCPKQVSLNINSNQTVHLNNTLQSVSNNIYIQPRSNINSSYCIQKNKFRKNKNISSKQSTSCTNLNTPVPNNSTIQSKSVHNSIQQLSNDSNSKKLISNNQIRQLIPKTVQLVSNNVPILPKSGENYVRSTANKKPMLSSLDITSKEPSQDKSKLKSYKNCVQQISNNKSTKLLSCIAAHQTSFDNKYIQSPTSHNNRLAPKPVFLPSTKPMSSVIETQTNTNKKSLKRTHTNTINYQCKYRRIESKNLLNRCKSSNPNNTDSSNEENVDLEKGCHKRLSSMT